MLACAPVQPVMFNQCSSSLAGRAGGWNSESMLRLARENPRLHAAWVRTQSGAGHGGDMDGEAVKMSSRPVSPAKTAARTAQTSGAESGSVGAAAAKHASHVAAVHQATQHTAAATPAHLPSPADATVDPTAAPAVLASSSGAQIASSVTVDAVPPVLPTQPLSHSMSNGQPRGYDNARSDDADFLSKRGAAAPEGSPGWPLVRFSLQVTQEPRPPSSPLRRSTQMRVSVCTFMLLISRLGSIQ